MAVINALNIGQDQRVTRQRRNALDSNNINRGFDNEAARRGVEERTLAEEGFLKGNIQYDLEIEKRREDLMKAISELKSLESRVEDRRKRHGATDVALSTELNRIKELKGIVNEGIMFYDEYDAKKKRVEDLRIKMAEIEMKASKQNPKIGDIRTYQSGTETITEEYTQDGWKPLGKGPKFKPGEKSAEDKKIKQTYEKMKRIEKILGEVNREISLFAEMDLEDMSETDRQTLLKSIESIADNPDISQRHRKLADEYLGLVDELYITDSQKPALDWRNYR